MLRLGLIFCEKYKPSACSGGGGLYFTLTPKAAPKRDELFERPPNPLALPMPDDLRLIRPLRAVVALDGLPAAGGFLA